MKEINHILVVCRLFKNLKIAARYGVSLSKRFGATLTIIHVVHDPYKGIERSNLPLPDLDSDFAQMLKSARTHIDDIIEDERESGVPIEVIIRQGKPAEQILSVVREKKIDLLVITAHREGRLEHFLFGDYDDELVRLMPCHILLVKIEPEPAPPFAD
jgi:universal stress protein A